MSTKVEQDYLRTLERHRMACDVIISAGEREQEAADEEVRKRSHRRDFRPFTDLQLHDLYDKAVERYDWPSIFRIANELEARREDANETAYR